MSTTVKSCLTRTFFVHPPLGENEAKDNKCMISGIYLKQETPSHPNFLPLSKLYRNYVYSEKYPKVPHDPKSLNKIMFGILYLTARKVK